MNHNKTKTIAVVLLAGAIASGAYAANGNAEAGLGTDNAETNSASVATSVPSPRGSASERRDDGYSLAVCITNWVDKYRVSPEFRIERDGTDTYVRGTVGDFPSLFSKYDIVIVLDSGGQEAYCYGCLPTKVPDERRTDMVEFLFRAECAYGLSPAKLVLDDDGAVRCQSWLPFKELAMSPEKAIPRLVGSVMEKLYACSQAAGLVLLDAGKPEVAQHVQPVGLFGKEYESEADTLAAETEMVLKNCFSDSEWMTKEDSGDWIAKHFAGADGNARFIRARFSDLKRDIGGIYDELHYTLVVRKGTVCNICPFPIDIPRDRLADIADLAMHINQSLKYGLFCVDFDTGKLWCEYALPVSSLRANSVTNVPNLNQVFIKTVATSSLARNSERISRAIKNETSQDGDGDSPKEQKIDEKEVERYRKAAEKGDAEACEMLGWEYNKEDKAEAVKWWCRAGWRGSDMMKAVLRLMFHGDERGLIYNEAGAVTAAGGCPLPDSVEPLALRVERGRRAYIDKWLGFSEPTMGPFPALAAVTNATGLKLDFAERFEAAVKGKMALFPDGGIRWTEDGTNGLSFAETAIKVRKAQIKCVREMMEGRKIANKAGTSWVLNEDFTFGYMPWHDMGNNDVELYVFSIRHEMNGKPPKTCVLVAFAPTQLVSDSIIGAFLGDETAKANLKAMEEIGIVTVMDD